MKIYKTFMKEILMNLYKTLLEQIKNNVAKEELVKLDHYNHAVCCANRIYNSAFFIFLSYSTPRRCAISSNSAIFL